MTKQRPYDRYAGRFHHDYAASASAKREAERQWRELPPDTRGLTGRLMGDPPAGRSALDKRRAAEAAAAIWQGQK
jgi:hypothetical protein